MKGARCWIVVAMLVTTILVLHAHGFSEFIPVSEPLSLVPRSISGWTGSDLQIDQGQLSVLGPGEFLSRIYARAGEAEPVGLFIGYFPSQRTGGTIHSPKNCLPGAGWAFQSSQYIDLKDATGKPHRVGEYILTKGDVREIAIYWYQAHGRSVANEYVAKFYLVADALRMNRTDGALVRVDTPISSGGGIAKARARAEAFTAQLMPMLPRFIPN